MTSTPVFNIAFQTVAAFVIFVTGFVAIFASVLVCVAAVWILLLCAKRLAVLLEGSQTNRAPIDSTDESRVEATEVAARFAPERVPARVRGYLETTRRRVVAGGVASFKS
ncbi:MAG TPA: hypothetical protein VK795_06770 [Terriglobales bacterium]|jgi:hypothetical protein|nr:hypothetical protein [Terriglobales bacterium]